MAEGTSVPALEDEAVLKEYLTACEAEKQQPLVGVINSFKTCCAEKEKGKLWVEARGSVPQAFHTRMTDDHLPVLTKVLASSLQFLTRIDLSYNNLTDAGCATIASGIIKDGASLKSLMLRGNSISSAGVESMLLNTHVQSLARLDISENPLGKLGGLALAAFLQRNSTLLELYASDTELDIDALIAISAVLHVNNDTLRVLDVQNPRLFSLQGEHATHFGKMLAVNPSLTEIYFGKFRFRDSSLELFLDDVAVDQQRLQVLDLRCNEIGAKGAECVSELVKWGQLRKLNLDHNRIGERENTTGAKALSEALVETRTLRHLSINKNSLCDRAIEYLLHPACAGQIERDFTLEVFKNDWVSPAPSGSGAAQHLFDIAEQKNRLYGFKCDAGIQQVDGQLFVCEQDIGDVLSSVA
ncbi:unnamed protein product [Amoebophrya sp. A120]|nr:unnamed protein product [Amoebophrya sp. A120]|eukprot:GSA120T00010921001.1